MVKYKTITEDGECIFCAIASGKLHTHGVFWEDGEFMAFLSIYPNTEGTTVVIPKKHYSSDVLKMGGRDLCKFILASKKVVNILLSCFDDVGRVGLVIEGTGINHAHIKLFPMHGTQDLKRGEWKQYHSNFNKFFKRYEGFIASNDSKRVSDKEIKKLAEKLRQSQRKK